jgi:N-acetylmuramoyl-L-alanine amidase
VIDHDPTYGACDDALFNVATLYEEMAERFSNSAYREKAIYYFGFVTREYPATRFKSAAETRIRQLQKTPAAETRTSQTSKPAGNETASLTEVRYWSNQDYTRVVLQLDREINFEKSVLFNPDRIFFDLVGTRIGDQLDQLDYDVNGLFIQKIRVAENRPSVVRVVLDFKQINQHTVFALYDPYRIVIDTRGNPINSSQPADRTSTLAQENKIENGPDAAENKDSSETRPSPAKDDTLTLTRTLGLKVGRVVIDPGHGGRDTGTIGPSGLREKDLVLDVSLRLKKLLEDKAGTEVILTRDSDEFIPLEERTAIANQLEADLFVSVHANAARNRKASGIETYVLDFAQSPEEREVASSENASAQRNISELEDLLRKIALGDYSHESRNLARVVQTHLVDASQRTFAGKQNRGIKQAPFIVLIGSNMPSILTEIGFISNPSVEKFYKKDESREMIAEALFLGIRDYLDSLGALNRNLSAATSTR